MRYRHPLPSNCRVIVGVVLAGLAWAALALPPSRPSSYFGQVTAGGEPVGAGRRVMASISGTELAETTTFLVDGESVFRLDVPGDVVGTPEIEGGQEGQSVEFLIDGAAAEQAGLWSDGADALLDLSVAVGPDLSVAVDDGVETVDPGDVRTYTVSVANQGPVPALGVQLESPLPPHTTFVSASDGGSQATGTVTWPSFDLTAGASLTRTVTVRVEQSFPPGTDVIVCGATAFGDGAAGIDPDPANNTASDVDTLRGGPNLVVSQTADLTQARPGDAIRYTIEVTNDGFQEAVGVQVSDTLPPQVLFFTATDDGIEAGGAVTWPAFDLPVGATATRTLRVRLDEGVLPGIAELESTATAVESGGLEIEAADNATVHLLPDRSTLPGDASLGPRAWAPTPSGTHSGRRGAPCPRPPLGKRSGLAPILWTTF